MTKWYSTAIVDGGVAWYPKDQKLAPPKDCPLCEAGVSLKGSPNDFTQDRNQWEASVLANATHYTATIFRGRGKYETTEHPTLAEAVAKAATLSDSQGRHGLVYAVTANGRSVQVPKEKWSHA
jgi:hypothetical protein